MEKYAVFTDNIEKDLSTIIRIKQYIKSKYSDIDFVIFSDNLDSVSGFDMGILPYFYMTYYDGTTIFLDSQQYSSFKQTMLNEPLLFVEGNDTDIEANTITIN